MSLKAFRLSLAILAATSLPALAATTQADVDKLRDALKPYLGPMTDQVKILPMDDGYKVTLDLMAFLIQAKAQGIDASLSPLEFTAKPAGGDIWKIHQEGDVSVAAKFPGGYVNEKFTGMTQDITLDLAQGLITEVLAVAKTISMDEQIPDQKGRSATVKMTADGLTIKSNSKANADGSSDTVFTESFGAWAMTEHSDAEAQPMDVTVKSTGGTFGGTLVGLKGRPLLDAWRFMIAHIKQKPTAADQGELKSALSASLPLFQSMSNNGAMTKVDISTPLGNFGAEKIGFTLNANGLVKDGMFEESLSIDGLTIPPGIAPPWANALVTKNAALDVKVTGFDLATWSKGMVDNADFSKDDPVPKNVVDALALGILPTGAATITIGPSSISNSTYNLSVQGAFSAGPAAQPSGKATVKMTGFDDVMKALTSAPPEAGLKDSGAVMIVAKGLGKTGGDGSISWDIEATPDGQFLVNGTDVKKLK